MIEKNGTYPVYFSTNEKLAEQKVMLSFTYEQLVELANILFYVNKVLARIPKWLGGVRLTETARVIHKAVHNSIVNCCLSLEEKYRFEQEGGKNVAS